MNNEKPSVICKLNINEAIYFIKSLMKDKHFIALMDNTFPITNKGNIELEKCGKSFINALNNLERLQKRANQ